ncbi:ATP synthase membrane subunit K, mitochondrial [Lemmus lemmus]
MKGPNTNGQFHITGIKKNILTLTLSFSWMNCVMAAQRDIALKHSKLRPSKTPAVNAT